MTQDLIKYNNARKYIKEQGINVSPSIKEPLNKAIKEILDTSIKKVIGDNRKTLLSRDI